MKLGAGAFEKEKELLHTSFPDWIIDVEHIGSTAVSDLAAKPIIDMIAAVTSFDSVEPHVSALKQLGYQYMREQRYEDRRLFVKGPEERRTHHLNIIPIGSKTGWENQIIFRDYLRRNQEARQRYADEKIKLAKLYPNDRYSYTKAKSLILETLLSEAIGLESRHA